MPIIYNQQFVLKFNDPDSLALFGLAFNLYAEAFVSPQHSVFYIGQFCMGDTKMLYSGTLNGTFIEHLFVIRQTGNQFNPALAYTFDSQPTYELNNSFTTPDCNNSQDTRLFRALPISRKVGMTTIVPKPGDSVEFNDQLQLQDVSTGNILGFGYIAGSQGLSGIYACDPNNIPNCFSAPFFSYISILPFTGATLPPITPIAPNPIIVVKRCKRCHKQKHENQCKYDYYDNWAADKYRED